MDPKFARAVESLVPSVERLCTASAEEIRRVPSSTRIKAVYVFSENNAFLYVGRSNHIRRRYSQHTNPGSRLHDAPFAVQLARQALGIDREYSGPRVRKGLSNDPAFRSAFTQAKRWILAMEFRFV